MSAVPFVEVKREDFYKYEGKLQAAHCMVFARLPGQTFEECTLRAAVLMQMRFDGHVGFPGGLVESGEQPVHGLIREMEEEMNFDFESCKLTEENHVVTHWHTSNEILLHFYALEVSKTKIRKIESSALESLDYGGEVMGTFRVPLYTMDDGLRGFPTFLKNSFIGHTSQQLKAGLLHASIMTEKEFEAAEAVSKNVIVM